MTLTLENISLHLGQTEILKNISTRFHPGQLNGLIGINGSGKSMLLKSILKLMPAKGSVSFNGLPLSPLDYSYIPQNSSISANFSVFEIILLGLYQDLSWKISEEEIQKVEEIAQLLHLEDLATRSYRTLSGGQQQMVLLAQALVKAPKLIFADEPTSALDISNQLEYMQCLQQYTQNHHCTTVIILHDLALMSRFIDYFYVLKKGQLIAEGDRQKILCQKVLEDVYHVQLDISKTKDGYLAILPISNL